MSGPYRVDQLPAGNLTPTSGDKIGPIQRGGALGSTGYYTVDQLVLTAPSLAAANTIQATADVVPVTVKRYQSGSTSDLQDWVDQAGAVLASISKTGTLTTPGLGVNTAPQGGGTFTFVGNSGGNLQAYASTFQLGSGWTFGWSSNANGSSGSVDTGMARQSAGVFGINGYTAGFAATANNAFSIYADGVPVAQTLSAINWQLRGDGTFMWASAAGLPGTADTGMSRAAAAIVAIGNGGQGDASGQIKCASATGSGTATFAATNCPATTLTHPNCWVMITKSDGTQLYMPAWA